MPAEQSLPPEVRQLGRQTAAFWRTTLRLVSALPFAGLAALSALLAVKAPGLLASAVFAALACFPAWLCAGSVGRTLRMYHGSEEASVIGQAMVAVSSLVGAAAVVVAVVIARMLPGMHMHRSEGSAKGNLGAIRSALSIYYGDMEGYYPLTPEALTVGGKYLSALPKARLDRRHPDSAALHLAAAPNDAGGWLYNNVPGNKAYGSLWINCTHTDRRGAAWTSY